MVNSADWAQGKATAEAEDSVSITNGAVAPGAGAVIATVNAPTTGMYEITAVAGYGGVADVVDNMDLAVNGVSQLALPVVAAVNGVRVPVTVRKRVVAAQAVAIRAIGAGGAGSVFRGTIVLRKISA